MLIMKPYFICWLFLMIFAHHAIGQDPKPILKLNAPQPDNVIRNACFNNCLINDVDFFTVKGIVNKNGSNSAAYKDTNLYLQAKAASSTNGWASQCRPDLTVCGKNLNTDCYCEKKDPNNGDYHIVMTIMAKNIYYKGSLMLSWNDALSPFNPPVLSNQVVYYNHTNISYAVEEEEEINGTNATFCVHNLEPLSLIQIRKGTIILIQTSIDSCVSVSINQTECQKFTLEYTESGGCERKDTIVYYLGPCEREWEDSEIALIVIFVALLIVGIVVIVVFVKLHFFGACVSAIRYYTIAIIVTCSVLIIIIPIAGLVVVLVKHNQREVYIADTGLMDYEIALLVIFCVVLVVILNAGLVVLLVKFYYPKPWNSCKVCPNDDEISPDQPNKKDLQSKPPTATRKL